MVVESACDVDIISYEPFQELAVNICAQLAAARTYACYVGSAVGKI